MATATLSLELERTIRSIPGYDPYAQAGDCTFVQEAAQYHIEFIEACCTFTHGPKAGRPFILEPWQKAVVANIHGWRRPNGLRRYRRVFLTVGRGNGKALAVDTPIPTPKGWTDMGELAPGDDVFDENGKVCQVVGATDVMHNRPCYRLGFSDGTSIVADAEHLWKTRSRQTGRPQFTRDWTKRDWAGLRTTKDIAATVLLPSKRESHTERNHSIATAGPLDTSWRRLPIPPYVLGAWLGDGTSANAGLTCGYKDIALIGHIKDCGVTVKEWKSSNKNSGLFLLGSNGRKQAARNNSLQAKLRKMNLLHNKHIPPAYLRASIRQRRALLQGLMDTDGFASQIGECDFTVTDKILSDGMMELLCSLGYKPTRLTDRATCNGKDCGPRYRVRFWAYASDRIFRLTRKQDRLKQPGQHTPRGKYRQIRSADSVASVPVKCIQVNSASGLFLAGQSMIPTHNSEFVAALVCDALFLNESPCPELWQESDNGQVCSAAAKRDQTKYVFDPVRKMIEACPEFMSRAELFKQSVVAGSKNYLTASKEGKTEHGATPLFYVIDELHAQDDRTLVDVIDTSMAKRDDSLLVYITTADFQRESICNEKLDLARKVRDNIIVDGALLPVIFEAAITDDWRSPDTWALANPNMGVSISQEAIAEQCRKAENSPAFENTFKRLHLNLQTAQETLWMDQTVWDACSDTPIFEKGCHCYGGMDLSSTSDFTAFAWTSRTPSGEGEEDWYDIGVRLWVPEARVAELEQAGYPQYRLWQKAGLLIAIPSKVIELGFVRAEIVKLGKEYNFVDIGYDKWSAWETAGMLQDDHGLTMVEISQGMKGLNESMKKLERLLKAGKIRHGGHPVLSWMFSNVMVKSDENDNIRPVKPPHTVTGKMTPKIDGIVALIMAIHRAMKQEAIPASPYATRGVRTIGG